MTTTPAQALDNLATAHIAPNGSPILPDTSGLFTAADGDLGTLAVFSDAQGAHVVGYVAPGASGWYVSYMGGTQVYNVEDRERALTMLAVQHEAARRVAMMVRAIRPAPEVGTDNTWDRGYNEALRDVEHLLVAAVGRAPEGEGFTAITRPTA